MLYLAIPAHNEVATIGVLLWRIRTVLAEFPREYEVVVYDDASSDETAEVAEQYAHAMPVTVLRGATQVGYAGALDALIRHVSTQTRYPRRDAMLLVQGDFTDPPGIVPEFARRFEGGADLVVGERMVVADAPVPVRRLFRAAHWAMRTFVRVHGVHDLTASMRLIRISALRDLVRQAGSEPVCVGNSWTANADLLLKLVPLARRVESVPMEPTYGVRMRDTRRVAVRDALAALKWAWGARGRRAVAGSDADAAGDSERRPARAVAPAGKHREETELSVEKLRERVRDRPRIDDEESFNGRREGRRRERERAKSERPVNEQGEATSELATERVAERVAERPADTAAAESRPPAERQERPKRQRADAADGEKPARPARPARLPRGERAARSDAPKPPRRPRDESRSPYSDPSVELEDPFAAPAVKRDGPDRALERALGPRDRDRESEAVTESPDVERSMTPPAIDERKDRDVDRDDAGGIGGDIGGDIGDDDSDSGDQDSGEADDNADRPAAQGTEGVVPGKKRRRNRRSRRGRAKKDGTDDDATEASAAPTGGDATAGDATGGNASGVPLAGAPPRSRTRAPKSDQDGGAANGRAADAGDDDGDTVSDGDESDLDSAARARRRGRRGRRGGARRSRGRRDKDGGDSGDAGAGESTDGASGAE